MTPAQRLTKIVDFFYIRPVRAVIPLQTFRYAICGGVNLGLNFILDKEIVRLGFVAISPYIAAFLVVFPITFVTGFWLQKHIAFKYSPLRGRTQLFRYLISVLGSVLLNYLLLKFFVEAVHLYPTPSQAVTSLLIIGYSYLMQKYFTFRGCES